jgi:hypothetical protein
MGNWVRLGHWHAEMPAARREGTLFPFSTQLQVTDSWKELQKLLRLVHAAQNLLRLNIFSLVGRGLEKNLCLLKNVHKNFQDLCEYPQIFAITNWYSREYRKVIAQKSAITKWYSRIFFCEYKRYSHE